MTAPRGFEAEAWSQWRDDAAAMLGGYEAELPQLGPALSNIAAFSESLAAGLPHAGGDAKKLRFVVRQLAGDLRKQRRIAERIAAGFADATRLLDRLDGGEE